MALPVAALILLLLLVDMPLGLLRQSGSAESAPQELQLTIAPTKPGTELAPRAVGLSLETQELSTQDLSDRHKSLVALMRPLGPGVLRVGGNSLDYSWWKGGQGQAPSWATSVITPGDLARLHGLLLATGWRVILGLDLGHFDPAAAAREAGTAERILGSRLLGFEIGNEPNDYSSPQVNLRSSSYSPRDYLTELAAYTAAVQSTAPGGRLFGPDLGAPSLHKWLSTIASQKSTPFTAITQHYYPTTFSFSKGTCKGTPVPTALQLLSPEVRERENAALQTITEAGKLASREVRITETNNTSSCDAPGGPATSPVFASALWSLDWVLRATSVGVASLNFHGRFGRCRPEAYTPICAPGRAAATAGHVVARPEYYGLLAARALEGGRFLPVALSGSGSTAEFSAYATLHPDGTITLAVDDFAATGSTSLVLQVPGYGSATGAPLIGSSLSATSGVSFGHASFSTGQASRPAQERIPQAGGAFQVRLAASSAIVITLRK